MCSLPPFHRTGRRFNRRTVLTLLAATPVILSSAARAQSRPIRVGILSGEDEDIWHIVQENARTAGLAIELFLFLRERQSMRHWRPEIWMPMLSSMVLIFRHKTRLWVPILSPSVIHISRQSGFIPRNGQACLLCRKAQQ